MPTQHKGVSAAEKYAELEARGEERPKCKCHSEPMVWKARTDYTSGGHWHCSIRARARANAWRDKNLDQARASSRASMARKYKANPDAERARGRLYYRNNREMILLSKKNKYESDPLWRLETLIKRSRRKRQRTLNLMREGIENGSL